MADCLEASLHFVLLQNSVTFQLKYALEMGHERLLLQAFPSCDYMEFAQSIERYMCTWILQLLLRAFLHLLSLSNWVAVEVEVIFGGELAYLIADDFAAFQSRKLLQRQPIQTELPIDLASEAHGHNIQAPYIF